MPYDPRQHHRRSIRIQGIDYDQPGAYFVTFVTHSRSRILSEVQKDCISLTEAGKAVMQVWRDLPHHYPHVALGDIVIMPNHVHAILIVEENNGSSRAGLPEIIRAWKSYSARRINALRGTPGAIVWQRGYYEHIVRDNVDYQWVREYIQANPLQWALDEENPSRK